MAKVKRYRVAKLFTASTGQVMTNDDEDAIRALPAKERAHHVERGNLIEYDADEKPPVPLADANATPKTEE